MIRKRAHIAFAALIATLLIRGVGIRAQTPVESSQPAQSRGETAGRAGRGGGGRGPALTSPEIGADNRVTFRLRAPEAREVSVVFAGGAAAPAPLPMAKSADGIWTATTPAPLAPELYTYAFNVDGSRFADPANATAMWASASRDTPGASSLLLVPGVPWTTLDVPHGAVAKHVYSSAIIGMAETYYVYTPPEYDHKRKAPYPVLVTLHGLGDGAQDWLVQGGANLTLDTLIAAGKAKPMILVSPAGYGSAQGTRGAAAGFPNFTRALLEEILPLVDKQYNASTKPSERAITGLSMGAAQSLLLLNHLDKFQWIGSFSPGFDMYSSQWGGGARNGSPAGGRGPQSGPGGSRGPGIRQRAPLAEGVLDAAFPHLDAGANKQIKLLYITCGTADDHLELTRQFKAFLDARKIASSYSEPEGAAHVWGFWRQQFAIFASQLFR